MTVTRTPGRRRRSKRTSFRRPTFTRENAASVLPLPLGAAALLLLPPVGVVGVGDGAGVSSVTPSR